MASLPVEVHAQLAPRGKPVTKTPATPGQNQPADPTGAGQPTTPAGTGTGTGTGTGSGQTQPAGQNPAGTGKKDPLSQLSTPTDIDYRPMPANQRFNFNIEDGDLPTLVKAISQISGRRFIYGNKLHQIKVTVYSPDDVTATEAYAAFLTVLNSNGMTVVPHGAFLEIIESLNSSKQPLPIYGTATPVPAEDRFITRLYRVNNIDVGEVATLLGTNFKSPDANITTYPAGNLLIITDTGANIRRMLRIVEELDVGAAGDQIWVQPLFNTSATDAAQKLNEILNHGGKGGGTNAVVPDDRTNSLIITANKDDYDKILELIKRVVDRPMEQGDNQIHVLPLQHAQCDELAQTLQQILGGTGGATPRPAGQQAGRQNRPTTATSPGTAAPEEIFEGPVKVACDTATNSLLTTSSLRDYAQLRAVIDELDQPRRQVFIEAVIMDLNVNHGLNLGIGYHGGGAFDVGDGKGAVYGGNNIGQSALGLPAELGALALGIKGPAIEGTESLLGTGVSIPALGVVLHALGTDSNSNVLATPHILATDNVLAEISVGQSVPLQTNVGGQLGLLSGLAGQAGAGNALAGLAGGLGGGFSAPYKDVGIKLSITPHVNDSDQVRLEIKEEISEVGSAPQGTLGAVTINQRMASTTLIVKDQQTVVIGGLMRDSETIQETKVPILGDIPVLGLLFKQHIKTKAKTNLLLILTPYVVRDQSDLRVIFERKMQERQEFLDRYFVFSEDNVWEPPRDYSRSNGLVEAIRQEMFAVAEKERLEQEIRPTGPKEHLPVEPIQLPTIAAPAKSGSASISVSGDETTTRPSTTGPTTNPPRAKIKNPVPAPTPKTE
ncbi:MAG: type II secretion system secretin GspD [Polyangiaceae bacterium]